MVQFVLYLNVAGPYVFGIGLISFLFSKELWLYEHQFTNFCSFWLAIYVLVRQLGDRWSKWADNYRQASCGLRTTCIKYADATVRNV